MTTTARILVADDYEQNVRLLTRILGRAGYADVVGMTDPRAILPACLEREPDILLLDLHMPGVDGVTVVEQLRARASARDHLPIIVVTGDRSAEARQRALQAGATDFLTKPYDPAEVVLRVRNQLEIRFLHRDLARENRTLEERVRERTRALVASQLEVLDRLAAAAEFRDDITGLHTRRVGILSARLAQLIGLDGDHIELIRHAAPLHDIGKIGIPDAILHKPGALSEEEFAVMKTHTTIGASILSGGGSDLILTAERIALAHHERWDGAGYPQGISGERIPLEARIVSVADFFDALTHDRPYRRAVPTSEVLGEIERGAGSQFEPRIAAAMVGAAMRGLLEEVTGGRGAQHESDSLAPPPPSQGTARA